MTVIHKYITRLFFKYFAIVLGVVIVIYLSIDFFQRIDKFIDAGLAPSLIAGFFLYKIPLIVSQITPVAVLLGVLSAFGLMAKNNEIIALKSGGVSLHYLLIPIIIIGIGFSVLLFLFSEVVVPISVAKSNNINEMRKASKITTSREKNIWIRGDRSITHIGYYNPSDQRVSNISIAFFNKEFELSGRINARHGKYRDGKWILSDCLVQTGLDLPRQNPQVMFYKKKISNMDFLQPSDLLKAAKKSEEMPFTVLYQYIQKVERQGYDATKYRVDFYAKTAFPFICVIIALLGAGLAFRVVAGEGMIISFAYGILTVFVYWTFYSFCLSLGYGHLLPPVLAAWAADLIFFCAAVLMVYNLE